MADRVCDICRKRVTTEACATCDRYACEECGRTVVENDGSVRRRERWECAECEFGGPGHNLDEVGDGE